MHRLVWDRLLANFIDQSRVRFLFLLSRKTSPESPVAASCFPVCLLFKFGREKRERSGTRQPTPHWNTSLLITIIYGY